MLQLDPMNTGHDERRAETGLARRQHIEGRRLACEWIETTTQIGKHLVRQGPGLASMLAAGEMRACDRRGLSATRCGGLVGACALGRGARPLFGAELRLTGAGDSAGASAGFIVEKARYPRHSRKAPRRSPQFGNAPSGPGTNLGNRRYSRRQHWPRSIRRVSWAVEFCFGFSGFRSRSSF
jgi:hypothetical protein